MPNIPPRPGRLLAAFWDFAFFSLSYPPYVPLGARVFLSLSTRTQSHYTMGWALGPWWI
ncbi:hypothetical protein V8C40DRAFT_243058 [Trichoderma camerunense]